MPYDLLQYKLKTARQKKRLQKKDFDKQLIQINRKRHTLFRQKQALPMVPLEEPYQKGWKRFFVLRDDVSRSDQAGFYQGILDKINTVQYSGDKSFKLKGKRKRKKIQKDRRQLLKEFDEWQWHNRNQALDKAEKAHFHQYERWSKDGKTKSVVYRFNEPWRYVLRVKPNMITEVKMLDQALEQEIQLLRNHVTTHQLDYRIDRLKGRKNYWNGYYEGIKPGYKDPFKNKAWHLIKDECDI